jgi:hypothetical protein
VHLPIWPLAAIVAGAAALMIGLTLIDAPRPASTPAVVTDVERFANSSAAVREQPSELIPAVGISHVTPNATTETFVGLENPGAYVAQGPTYATGLENPGAYVVQTPTYATGLENPGAYVSSGSGDGVFEGTMGLRPGMTGDEICGQCR